LRPGVVVETLYIKPARAIWQRDLCQMGQLPWKLLLGVHFVGNQLNISRG
jgi:hypothetical protein